MEENNIDSDVALSVQVARIIDDVPIVNNLMSSEAIESIINNFSE